MEPRSLAYITNACHGSLLHGHPDTLVHRVCTDTRLVQPEDLFVALSGPRHDGHDFLQMAARAGAAAAVVERHRATPADLRCGLIAVENTRRALIDLASRYRSEFQLPVVAVAGSNGKTTTKNLLAAVLGEHRRTLSSEASFNNDIGVPLTLLRLQSDHAFAVLEAGTNHPGELEPLLRLIQPTFGVLTHLGPEHLEFFGTIEGVTLEEGWIAEVLPKEGRLFVDGDIPQLEAIVSRCAAPVTRVGLGATNDWIADQIVQQPRQTTFRLTSPRADYRGAFAMPLLGRHQVTNALLALAVGAEWGVSADQARRGLAHCRPANMRMELQDTRGWQLLNDTYNANEDSMKAALETCRDLPCQGRRVAVLGDMAELGSHAARAHEQVGIEAARCGMDLLVAVGRWADVMAGAARGAGLRSVEVFDDADRAARYLEASLAPGDLVLIKASRATGLEGLAARLRG